MQLLHIRAIFAQSTLAYYHRDCAPPPFSLLRLPYKTFAVLSEMCRCGRYNSFKQFDERIIHEEPEYIFSTALKQDVEELQKKMDDEVQRRTSRIKEEEHVAEEIRSALGKVCVIDFSCVWSAALLMTRASRAAN